ncbi:MAG: type II secretion system protein [Candidatus Omnitrophota bacterium]|jgi:type II secretory pathway pseudopilin PulG
MKKRRGKSFVALMIAIAVCALGLRIALTQLLRINISQNESNALGTLKLISAALENYARDKEGSFPNEFSLLAKSKPAYLDRDYILASPLKGYNYTCSRLEPAGYSCSASPAKCGLTGKTVYTVTTAGLVVSEECNKKE